MRTLGIGLCLAVIATGLIASGQGPKQRAVRESIPLSDLRTKDIIGELGHPLGTVVEFDGVFEMSQGREQFKGGENVLTLKIESVNGRRLQRSVQYDFIEFRPTVQGQDPQLPPPKSRFRLAGYETGEFMGLPIGYDKYELSLSGRGFHFTPQLKIVANLAARTERNIPTPLAPK